jgi:hypothetical protein
MTAVRYSLSPLILLALAGVGQAADGRGDTTRQGTYLGVLFSPVPQAQFLHNCQRLARPFLGPLATPTEDLAARLPPIPGTQGVRITHVLPNSPADKVDLRRDDVLLCYNGAVIRDCLDFARLIQTDKPDNKVKLSRLRDQSARDVEVTLTLGPAIRIVPLYSRGKAGYGEEPRATSKTTSPPPVSVSLAPLTDGTMKVTIEYYPKDSGKLHTITCQGRASEIDEEVKRLPRPERDQVQTALERLRAALKPSERR